MALTKDQKTEVIEDLKTKMNDAKCVVFADYKGLSVKDMSELRAQLREKGVAFVVAKKTLIKIAAGNAGYTDLSDDVLEGPVGVAFSMEDEIAGAKMLKEFSKKHEELDLRGALFEGKVLSVAETQELASLPGKEELLGKLVFLLNSPISGFHGVLNNTLAGFVRVLDAIKEKQESA